MFKNKQKAKSANLEQYWQPIIKQYRILCKASLSDSLEKKSFEEKINLLETELTKLFDLIKNEKPSKKIKALFEPLSHKSESHKIAPGIIDIEEKLIECKRRFNNQFGGNYDLPHYYEEKPTFFWHVENEQWLYFEWCKTELKVYQENNNNLVKIDDARSVIGNNNTYQVSPSGCCRFHLFTPEMVKTFRPPPGYLIQNIMYKKALYAQKIDINNRTMDALKDDDYSNTAFNTYKQKRFKKISLYAREAAEKKRDDGKKRKTHFVEHTISIEPLNDKEEEEARKKNLTDIYFKIIDKAPHTIRNEKETRIYPLDDIFDKNYESKVSSPKGRAIPAIERFLKLKFQDNMFIFDKFSLALEPTYDKSGNIVDLNFKKVKKTSVEKNANNLSNQMTTQKNSKIQKNLKIPFSGKNPLKNTKINDDDFALKISTVNPNQDKPLDKQPNISESASNINQTTAEPIQLFNTRPSSLFNLDEEGFEEKSDDNTDNEKDTFSNLGAQNSNINDYSNDSDEDISSSQFYSLDGDASSSEYFSESSDEEDGDLVPSLITNQDQGKSSDYSSITDKKDNASQSFSENALNQLLSQFRSCERILDELFKTVGLSIKNNNVYVHTNAQNDLRVAQEGVLNIYKHYQFYYDKLALIERSSINEHNSQLVSRLEQCLNSVLNKLCYFNFANNATFEERYYYNSAPIENSAPYYQMMNPGEFVEHPCFDELAFQEITIKRETLEKFKCVNKDSILSVETYQCIVEALMQHRYNLGKYQTVYLSGDPTIVAASVAAAKKLGFTDIEIPHTLKKKVTEKNVDTHKSCIDEVLKIQESVQQQTNLEEIIQDMKQLNFMNQFCFWQPDAETANDYETPASSFSQQY